MTSEERREHNRRISNLKQYCNCTICKKEFNRRSSLSIHIRIHKISLEEYYLQNNQRTFCKCCGKETKFVDIFRGYNKFCSAKCGTSGEFNGRYGIPTTEENRKKQSRMMIDNNPLKNPEIAKKVSEKQKGVPKNFSEETRKKLSDRIKAHNARGWENRGGRTKFYKIGDVIVQGRYEFCFYMLSKEEGANITKGKRVNTPFGTYTPDFKIDNKHYEIKSTYTVEVMENSPQKLKIDWFRENIGELEVVVLDDLEVDEYLLKFNLNDFIHKV